MNTNTTAQQDAVHGRPNHHHSREGRHHNGQHGDRHQRVQDAAREHRGRFGNHGRRGGRGGGVRVGRGDVRAAILLLLSEAPMHGYQLIHRIEERSGGLWRPSPGSVYPALQLLEDEGLVRPEQQEGRRVFHLTEAGQAYVAQQQGELEAARDAVIESVNPTAQALDALVHQLTVAVRQVTEVGTAAQLDAARDTLISARRSLYRILAEDVPAQPVDNPGKGDDAYV